MSEKFTLAYYKGALVAIRLKHAAETVPEFKADQAYDIRFLCARVRLLERRAGIRKLN